MRVVEFCNELKTLIEKGDLEKAVEIFEELVDNIENIEKEFTPEENSSYIKSVLAKSILLDKDLDKIRSYEQVKLKELKLQKYI